MNRHAILTLLTSVMLFGCVQITGPYYLNNGLYDDGIRSYKKVVQEQPGDASAWYYLGRMYLAKEKPEKALGCFKRAVVLAPDDTDYWFWIGVTKWALLDFDGERAAYEKALALDPGNLSARLYLGHNLLDRGMWRQALSLYDSVIRDDEYNPEALYNRTVALKGLGRIKEEKESLLEFLEYYPDGSFALQGTARLNEMNDFTYRNYIIGFRNVTLLMPTFKTSTADLEFETKESLAVIAAMMEINTRLRLHVVAYVNDNKSLARERALAVKDSILSGHPYMDPERLIPSWFGVHEKIDTDTGEKLLDESVRFITVTNQQ